MAACIHFLATFLKKQKYFDIPVENVNKVAKIVQFDMYITFSQTDGRRKGGRVVIALGVQWSHLF